jgi:septal ring factor EnvC (AmiA/AmiB activator)
LFSCLHACLHCAALQTTHQDAVSSLQSEMQQTAAAQESLREQLAQQEATIQEQLQQLEDVNATIVDLQNQLGKQTAWHLGRNLSIQHVKLLAVYMHQSLNHRHQR